jgi:ATP-dependent RNA helicase RhlE
VRAAGYETPTEIQTRAIPLVLEGRDLIALGQTGSGKTAAFGLPILHRLTGGSPGLRAVILVPTRELCVQVAESLRGYAQRTGLSVCTAFGGVALSIQESAFRRGLDVLVACPGRLIDHLERGNVDMRDVSMVVLDEADRMLDMGFLPQIRSILVRCPQERQNLLFSATMPPDVEGLCKNFLPDAVRVQVGARSQAASSISHRFAAVKAVDKEALLEKLLRREPGRVLIFCNTKIRCERVGRRLKQAGLPADSLHGDKEAEARHTILRAFERGRTRFLVATDVAARGIDVD